MHVWGAEVRSKKPENLKGGGVGRGVRRVVGGGGEGERIIKLSNHLLSLSVMISLPLGQY